MYLSDAKVEPAVPVSDLATARELEQVHDARIDTNEKGIAELRHDRMAWFKDPDGNFHAIVQA